MPTPSSNQSPDPSSTPPFSFQTCPDDVQFVSRPTQSTAIEVRPQLSLYRSPSLFPEFPAGQREHDVVSEPLILSGQIFLEPSSRRMTVPPGPQLFNSEPTSLVPGAPDGNGSKTHAIGPDGPVCQTPSAASRSPRGDISASSHDRDADSQESLPYEDEDDMTCSISLGMDFCSIRTIPASPSSFLRPGSRFHGTQQSERQVYEVQVEIKHVDMRESFLCGYLRIQGLTEDHPMLTTYFEGEIIGSKYGFITQHEDWGANIKTDMNHWGKFSAFRPLQKQVRKGPVTIHEVAQRDDIFMRWKEHFLVPDHRVRTITGASFEGFYYICFNQLEGTVSGIYFHSKSEKFQQLELKHLPNRGCFSATEFR